MFPPWISRVGCLPTIPNHVRGHLGRPQQLHRRGSSQPGADVFKGAAGCGTRLQHEPSRNLLKGLVKDDHPHDAHGMNGNVMEMYRSNEKIKVDLEIQRFNLKGFGNHPFWKMWVSTLWYALMVKSWGWDSVVLSSWYPMVWWFQFRVSMGLCWFGDLDHFDPFWPSLGSGTIHFGWECRAPFGEPRFLCPVWFGGWVIPVNFAMSMVTYGKRPRMRGFASNNVGFKTMEKLKNLQEILPPAFWADPGRLAMP